MRNQKICRRRALQGLGVSMALPWMESMTVSGGRTASGKDPESAADDNAPVRMACAVLWVGLAVKRMVGTRQRGRDGTW